MVRNRKRKTVTSYSKDDLASAVRDVRKNGAKIRAAAKSHNVPFTTLQRYIKRMANDEEDSYPASPNYASRKVFNSEQEHELKEYLLKCSKMCYGLTTRATRKLAYQLAKINNIKVPASWDSNEMAGLDWMQNFKKRHPELAIRKPESCSLSRATSFNRHNVQQFFENLRNVIQREPQFSDGTRIFNLDETATTTVPDKQQKVLAQKGEKQVAQATSGERGVLVTTCCIISATGNTLPPAMVFPRVNFKPWMLKDAPPGTLGLANKSGWMTADLFVQVMEHFIKHSVSSKEKPSLLILDNHESHLSIEALNLAKDNGVTILTIPPHTSNKLQPLDVSCYFPFKAHYSAALNSKMMERPGTPLTIYDIAGCVRTAHERGLTPTNIISGFKKTGIFPFDCQIFTDSDFIVSEVTNRVLPQQDQEDSSVQEKLTAAGTSGSSLGSSSFPAKSPQEVKSLPKAAPRKKDGRGRRKGKSMIATDTPEKEAIENAKKGREKLVSRKLAFKKKEKKGVETSDDDIEDDSSISYAEESMDEDFIGEDEEDLVREFDRKSLKEGDFVLVGLKSNKTEIFYVGKIIGRDGQTNDYEISYLRKSSKIKKSFHFPTELDIKLVSEDEIKVLLPKPALGGKTKRQQSYLSFGVDFSNVDVR